MKFSCPSCGAELEIDDSYAGLKASCETCGVYFIIPAPGCKACVLEGESNTPIDVLSDQEETNRDQSIETMPINEDAIEEFRIRHEAEELAKKKSIKEARQRVATAYKAKNEADNTLRNAIMSQAGADAALRQAEEMCNRLRKLAEDASQKVKDCEMIAQEAGIALERERAIAFALDISTTEMAKEPVQEKSESSQPTKGICDTSKVSSDDASQSSLTKPKTSQYIKIPQDFRVDVQVPPLAKKGPSPRQRRLMADHETMKRLFDNFPFIHLESAIGNPPEKYVMSYNVRSIEKVDGDNVIYRGFNQVEIILPGTYPRTPPLCRMLTPIFHPNIEPATICIGDYWTAAERLCDLVIRIGEIITYQAYNIKSPLDGEAAMWADLHQKELPIDNADLTPPNL